MKRFDKNATLSGLRWSLLAGLATSWLSAFAAGSAEVAPATTPLTLMIQSPTGGAVRLTYVADEGWKADPSAALAKQGAGRVEAVSTAPPDAVADLDESMRKPMTVFIDGPTGFTYFWSRERGWKFVGRLTERLQ